MTAPQEARTREIADLLDRPVQLSSGAPVDVERITRTPRPGQRGRGRVEREPEDCPVFLRDNHPAYISWEQYQGNRRRLKQQRRRGPAPGPARTTTAALAGLVVCGQCRCRMQTRYTRTLRYDCQRHALDYAAPACRASWANRWNSWCALRFCRW